MENVLTAILTRYALGTQDVPMINFTIGLPNGLVPVHWLVIYTGFIVDEVYMYKENIVAWYHNLNTDIVFVKNDLGALLV